MTYDEYDVNLDDDTIITKWLESESNKDIFGVITDTNSIICCHPVFNKFIELHEIKIESDMYTVPTNTMANACFYYLKMIMSYEEFNYNVPDKKVREAIYLSAKINLELASNEELPYAYFIFCSIALGKDHTRFLIHRVATLALNILIDNTRVISAWDKLEHIIFTLQQEEGIYSLILLDYMKAIRVCMEELACPTIT